MSAAGHSAVQLSVLDQLVNYLEDAWQSLQEVQDKA